MKGEMVLRDKVELTVGNSKQVLYILNRFLSHCTGCMIYSNTGYNNTELDKSEYTDYIDCGSNKVMRLVYSGYIYSIEDGYFDDIVITTYSEYSKEYGKITISLGDIIRLKMINKDGNLRILVEIKYKGEYDNKGKVWIIV